MTHFHVEVDLTCPSNWKEEDARKWVSRFMTEEEAATLRITDTDALKALANQAAAFFGDHK